MNKTRILRNALAGLALATTLGSVTPAIADHTPPAPIDPAGEYFRGDHPLRVYVDIDTDDRRHGDRHFENAALYSLNYNLPRYVKLVENPRYADMTIKVDLDRYDLNFRVVDRDREDKKYSDAAKRRKGECGHLYRAFYTEVKEKAEAEARYTIKTRLRHHGSDIDRLRIESEQSFKYVTDLKAQTNCGLIETWHSPNSDVREMLAHADPSYRDEVAREVRREAAEDLGTALAGNILADADRYYAGLARFMMARNDSRYRGHDWFDDDRWDEDWRDENDRHDNGHHDGDRNDNGYRRTPH